MTAPTLPTTVGPLGPGTLTIGLTGTPIDVSCLVNSARIENSKTSGEPVYKLCGKARPATAVYAWSLTANVDVDIADQAGLAALSWEHAGETVDYSFTPNTGLGVTYTGQLTIDPVNVGADAYGDIMTSDITYTLAGMPTVTYPAGP